MVFIAFYSKCNGRSLENFSRKAVDQAVFKMVHSEQTICGWAQRGSQETSQEDTAQIQVREAGGLEQAAKQVNEEQQDF